MLVGLDATKMIYTAAVDPIVFSTGPEVIGPRAFTPDDYFFHWVVLTPLVLSATWDLIPSLEASQSFTSELEATQSLNAELTGASELDPVN